MGREIMIRSHGENKYVEDETKQMMKAIKKIRRRRIVKVKLSMRKMKGRIAYHFVVLPQVDLLASLGSSPSVLHILKIVLYLHSPQHFCL
jgi:hypothetical protein